MDPAKILLVKGQAGLGNRILSLLTAILYARFANRTLMIDWRDAYYSNDGSNSFGHFLNYNGSNFITEIPETDSIAPSIWQNQLHDTVTNVLKKYSATAARNPVVWSKFSIDLSRLDHEEDIVVMWSYVERINALRRHFKGEFAKYQRQDNKTVLRNILAESLHLNPGIQQKVDDFSKDWPAGKTVGLHIRYSDKKSRLSSMLKKLDALLKQNPDLQIFVATDNIEIQNYIEEKYPRVLSTPKTYPEPGAPIHFGFTGSDQLKQGVEALVDMYLLAACDYLILDESSAFAYVATLLSKAPRHRIFNCEFANWIPASIKYKIWVVKTVLELKLFLK